MLASTAGNPAGVLVPAETGTRQNRPSGQPSIADVTKKAQPCVREPATPNGALRKFEPDSAVPVTATGAAASQWHHHCFLRAGIDAHGCPHARPCANVV